MKVGLSVLGSLAMSVSVEALCIAIDPEFQLPNSAPSQPIRLKGNYVAFAEPGSDPRAYKLYIADANWKATGPSIATVFVVIDQQGQARFS